MKLVGDKVYLRYPTVDDAEEIFERLTSKIRRTAHIGAKTVQDQRAWLKSHPKMRREKQEIHFAIVEKKTEEIIGLGGFCNLHMRKKYGEVGVWITESKWKKGFAKEATKLFMKYGFEDLNLNRVEAVARVKNPAAWRLLENLGMTREGTLRQRAKLGDKPADDYMYSILKSEWGKKNANNRD
jgi:[ribosomal protein S5]-alanine N-acetyltransferase